MGKKAAQEVDFTKGKIEVKTFQMRSLKVFGTNYNEIVEGPARRIQEFFSEEYETIHGKNLAIELLMGSKMGPVMLPGLMMLAMINAGIPWIYGWYRGYFFKNDLDKIIQGCQTFIAFMVYMMNLVLFSSLTLLLFQKMHSKRKLLCMIDSNYYNTYKIEPTLPIISMYKRFNYQQIINLYTVLQKMEDVYMARGIYLASLIIFLSSLQYVYIIFETIFRENSLADLGILFNSYAFFNLLTMFGLFSQTLIYGAEANLVDEKLRDEIMAMKKKTGLMEVICQSKKVMLK